MLMVLCIPVSYLVSHWDCDITVLSANNYKFLICKYLSSGLLYCSLHPPENGKGLKEVLLIGNITHKINGIIWRHIKNKQSNMNVFYW